MAFLLGNDGRNDDVLAAFRRYHDYVESQKEVFPPSAYALATSNWYFNPDDHRSPHDGWLEACSLSETSAGKRGEERTLTLRVRILGAYQDGHIEISYPRVFSYTLAAIDGMNGHCDWRFDEFRVSDRGRLIHEIEWRGIRDTARWTIEASDLEFNWFPTVS